MERSHRGPAAEQIGLVELLEGISKCAEMGGTEALLRQSSQPWSGSLSCANARAGRVVTLCKQMCKCPLLNWPARRSGRRGSAAEHMAFIEELALSVS